MARVCIGLVCTPVKIASCLAAVWKLIDRNVPCHATCGVIVNNRAIAMVFSPIYSTLFDLAELAEGVDSIWYS